MAPAADGSTVVSMSPLLPHSPTAASSAPAPFASSAQPRGGWLQRPALLAGAALLVVAALAIGLGVGLGLPKPAGAPSAPYYATALMRNGSVSGTVSFSSSAGDGSVNITIDLQAPDFPDGLHGLHVHASVLSSSTPLDALCAAAGSHLNPGASTHGCPGGGAAPMHAGDLGNVRVIGGKVQATLTSSAISLDPAASNSVVNRALVLHALEDDCGLGPPPGSSTTGNSGARIVCAVILAGLNGA